jgi:phosphoribosylaminoimidazolecarboxamide formyltransferase/IMP cyclohydrolase
MSKKLRHALISVTDKHRVTDFAGGLTMLDSRWRILSTGGTAKVLREAGVRVTDVSKYTGHPECLDGRIKTLHSKIFGGILAKKTKKHRATLKKLKYPYIELVVVNLYPFEQTVADPNVKEEAAIEQIDIGGPSMIRSAGKNFDRAVVVVDPADYDWVLREYAEKGDIDKKGRLFLAAKVFQRTSEYDAAIWRYMTGQMSPDQADFLAQKGLA